MGATARESRPVTYGTPDQAAKLYESIAKLTEVEPNRTFADDEVRKSARRLARLLYVRLDGEAPDEE
jgi:hypothetical protein